MNALRWAISGLVVLTYVGFTGIFFADWNRLAQTASLSEPELLLHCLLSGGAVSAALAIYFAVKRSILGVVGSIGLLPLEIALSYVLIAAGFGYWLSLKLFLIGCLLLLIRFRSRRQIPGVRPGNGAEPGV